MNILITGMNTLQTNKDHFLKQQLKVAPSHYSLIRCLEDMGHNVEQRAVLLGETLNEYDEVIFFMHSPQSFCQNLYLGLYALSQRPDAILAFDDWQVDQIYGGIGGIAKAFKANDETAYRDYILEMQNVKYSRSEYMKYNSCYSMACDIILNKNNRLLISAFSGGDLGLLNLGWQEDRVFSYNPNAYHYNRTPGNDFLSGVHSLFGSYVEPEEKLKQWNFASLVQKKTAKWLKNQNITWNLTMYGQKSGPDKNERLTEDKMCAVFARDWGCLMPGYKHQGSGWWRARPLQVADVGSILVGDYAEMKVLYRDDFIAKIKAEDIEQMGLTDLEKFAKMQHDCLYDNHPLLKSVQQLELNSVLLSASYN